METRRFTIITLFSVLLIVNFWGMAVRSPAEHHDATVVFGVTWYDVGKAALEGLAGVKRVSRGWRGFMEINTVVYDSSLITVEQMEKVLKKAGTYRKTFKD